MKRFATPAAVFDWASGLVNLERRPGETRDYKLDRMAALLAALGNPHRDIPSIHVAGSKGKGSCSSMLAACLSELGLYTGVFQSPHVLDWRERLRPVGGFFEDQIYIEQAEILARLIDELETQAAWTYGHPTTFEVLTALAHLVFKAAGVQIAVFEVGLGGRLDATNLITPLASVITHLELEHTEILGPTLSHIAFEKAGIIKQGVPVYTYTQRPEAEKVLQEQASERACVLTIMTRPADSPEKAFSYQTLAGEDISFTLGALGEHQADNARLVLACLEGISPELQKLFPGLPTDASDFLSRAIGGLNRTLQPGRGTILSKGDRWIMADGAHTPDSVASVLGVFAELAGRQPGCPLPVLLCGLVEGKLYEAIAMELVSHISQAVITRPGSFKESQPQAVFEAFKRSAAKLNPGLHLQVLPNEREALDAALALAAIDGSPLLVCGSFHLLGMVLPLLLADGWVMADRYGDIEGFFACP